MGESAVALRYAEALYELAKEGEKTSRILEDLAGLKAAFDADREGFAKVVHPRVDPTEKIALLDERFLAGRDSSIANLMRLMVRRRRESILRDFFRMYLEIHEQREGIVRVEVETATALEASVAQNIRQQLAEATGKKVVLEARLFPGLLGGMRFRIGSHLLDGSVRRRLEKIERGLRTTSLDA